MYRGYIFTEEHKRKLREKRKGRTPSLGMKHTEETKEIIRKKHQGRIIYWNNKISKALKGRPANNPFKTGKENISWIGGDYSYWHQQSYKLFGKDNCQFCNKTLEQELQEQRKRFHMHCTSIPKNYELMTPENWLCVCNKCHITKLDANRRI
jgi:hypothetical protein